MTKAITLLLLSSIIGLMSYAQPQGTPLHPFYRKQTSNAGKAVLYAQLRRLQTILGGSAGAKTTGIGKRLVAWSVYDPLFADSAIFSYGGNRGSYFDFDELSYSLDSEYPFPAPGQVMFDTAWLVWPMNGPQPFAGGAQTYNSAGAITRFEDLTILPELHRRDFAFNAQGQFTSMIEAHFDGSWQTTFEEYLSYNSQGWLSRDSSRSWDGSNWGDWFIAEYQHDAAGNPILLRYYHTSGIPANLDHQAELTYDASNRLRSSLRKTVGSNATLENSGWDTMAYTGGRRTFELEYGWDVQQNAWVLAGEIRRHLNAANLIDSVWTAHYFNGQSDTVITRLAYNADGLPVHQFYYDAGNQFLRGERFYYESYDLGVAGHSPMHKLEVYPNPATNLLHVDAMRSSRGAVQYTLTDAAGRKLRDIVLSAGQAGADIDVASLPSGQYFLLAQDGAGQCGSATFIRK